MNNWTLRSYFWIFSLSIIFSFNALAQEKGGCGTVEIDESWLRYFANNKLQISQSRNCDIYVPITVHILGDDSGLGYYSIFSLFKSIETLNNDFESSGIKFYLSGPINYINKSIWYEHTSFSVGTQMMNTNNVPNTINSYIVENAANNCGYRAFSGNAVAMAKSCMSPNDHTWAHEIGHFLSLPHTFRGWEGTNYDGNVATPSTVGVSNVELFDGSNCDASGDFFCDTSPDYISYRWQCDGNNESEISLKDPTGAEFKSDGSLIMSYAFDNCQSRFSPDQELAMCSYLQERIPEFVSTKTPLGKVDPLLTKLIFPKEGDIVEPSIRLEWEETGNATFYIVEVSRVANFAIPSYRELVYDNHFDVSLNPGTTYHWRVRPMNEYDTDFEKFSEKVKFETGNTSSTIDYYETNLKIYPNPLTNGNPLILELQSIQSEEVTFNVYSMDGSQIFSTRHFIKSGSNKIQLNIPQLPKGMFLLSATGIGHKFHKKIVID